MNGVGGKRDKRADSSKVKKHNLYTLQLPNPSISSGPSVNDSFHSETRPEAWCSPTLSVKGKAPTQQLRSIQTFTTPSPVKQTSPVTPFRVLQLSSMASGGLPSFIEPPGTPPTPAFNNNSSSNDPSFQFVCDDFDQLNNNNNHDHVHNLDPNPGFDFRAPSPRSSPAAFLHPNHTHPRPRMSSSEDGIAIGNGNSNGAPADAPAPRNPFNFQTQVYSAGPAKPVCDGLLLSHFIPVPSNTFSPPTEHRAASRAPLQTQFDKRNPPVLPGTSSPTAPSPARLPPDPDF